MVLLYKSVPAYVYIQINSFGGYFFIILSLKMKDYNLNFVVLPHTHTHKKESYPENRRKLKLNMRIASSLWKRKWLNSLLDVACPPQDVGDHDSPQFPVLSLWLLVNFAFSFSFTLFRQTFTLSMRYFPLPLLPCPMSSKKQNIS